MACYFIATSYRQKSVPRYFFALARELSARGHRVVVLVDRQRHDAVDKEKNPAIVTWPSPRPTRFRDARFLHALVREFRPTCLIANFGSVNLSILTGWLNRVPCRIAWQHTLSKQLEGAGGPSGWKLFLLRQRKRLVLSFATHVISNSQATAVDAQRVYKVAPEKCRVLPFLISDPAVEPSEVRPKKVLCVGRMHPSKGQATLIRAIPQLVEAVPEVVVELVGDGMEREDCEKLADRLGVTEQCRFVGSRSPGEVLERMASAAVCVVPSTNEAFGVVNIEAQSVGTPVVASAVDGLKEAVIDGETGFLVPPGAPDAFAEKIALLLRDEKLRRTLGLKARQNFQKTFSNKNISKHAEFMERLAGGG